MRSTTSIFSIRLLSRSWAAMALGLAVGCAAPPAPAPSAPPPGTASVSHPMIVRLVGRDDMITIYSGPAGPLYTVADSTGRVLVSEMTIPEMKKARPDLYDRLFPAMAPSAVVWAGD